MATLREWVRRVLGSLNRNGSDADLEEELRAHMELARQQSLTTGSSERDARLKAGGMAQTMDALRDQRALPWLDDLTRDIRYALRTLRRSPMFTAVVLLTLAIGIGANTAVFSVVDAILIKPLPYPDAEQLVAVKHVAPGAPGLTTASGDLRLSPSMYFTYADQNRVFQAFGVYFPATTTVTGVAEPEQVRSVALSDGTLQALGVRPILGRWLSADDQKQGSTAVLIGYGYWQRRFGGDRSIVGGRAVTMDSRPREVVGVMPPGFRIVTSEPDVIVPVGLDRSRAILPGFGFPAIGRLKPGLTLADASADIARLVPIWNRSWPAFPGVNPRIYESWRITPALRPLKDEVVGNVTNALWVLMATIGIVMVIACANVANLMLVRAERRQQELAVRAALGAGWGRIIRARLVESVVLGVFGGVLGVGLAYAGLRVLVANSPATLPRVAEIALDSRSLLFTLAISWCSALLFGLIPAVKYAGPQIAHALHGGGRGASDSRDRHRVRHALVIGQVALALMLLVSAGLMIRTSRALRHVDPGFTTPNQLQVIRLNISPAMIQEAERVSRVQHDLVDRLAAIPGVTSVAFSSALPMEGIVPNWDAVVAEGQTYGATELPPFRLFKGVSPGYFQTLGTRIVAGREYTWADLDERRDVTIISDNMARELFGAAPAAVGKRIRQGTAAFNVGPWKEIVGVAADVRENGVHQPAPTTVYWLATRELLSPQRQMQLNVTRATAYVIRSSRTGTESFLGELRQSIWAVNTNLPVTTVRTMGELYDESMARTSFTLVMLAIAGVMALLLGVIGIYGVMSYVVSQRTREIGIRLALGASASGLKAMFVQHGLVLVGAGVLIGLLVAAGLSRLMASLLFGISPLDPLTFAVVPIVLTAATVLASYLPARRATLVDPVEILKAE
jgi:predicted permease